PPPRDEEGWDGARPEERRPPAQARYRDHSGREHAKRFDRKIDAERWLATTQAAHLRGEWVDPAAGRMTAREFAELWLEMQVWRDSRPRRREPLARHHPAGAGGGRDRRGRARSAPG
ncbi:MAG: hypothetical protein ACRDY5_07185, partial [Acidimicrobiales bacterium]